MQFYDSLDRAVRRRRHFVVAAAADRN